MRAIKCLKSKNYDKNDNVKVLFAHDHSSSHPCFDLAAEALQRTGVAQGTNGKYRLLVCFTDIRMFGWL